MKVVHLVTHDKGGAYNAAKRINEALSRLIDSEIITIKDIPKGKMNKLMHKIMHKLYFYLIPFNKNDLAYYFNTDLETMPVAKYEKVKDADIIHIHWVADGMLNIRELKKLTKLGKLIVWTLHDMHPFTGGCHYDDACEKYKGECSKCKQINSTKKKDFSWWNQKKKRDALENAHIIVVGCSEWITTCAKESLVMKNKNCITIPNCIDTQIYKPGDKMYARERLNISVGDKKIIAFGAMSATSDKRKGFMYLQGALEHLDKEKYACLILGGNGEVIEGMQTITIDYLNDDYSLSLFYTAADVFVAPSVQENLANTVMESLACGIPVVAFNIGGMPDLIKSEYNGYLAEPFDVMDMAKGIMYCCEDNELNEHAIHYVMNNFGMDEIASKYLKLYRSFEV